jgi:hypothetical protein
MRRNAKRAATLLLIAVAGFCGCSRQGTLARQIANADHLVVSNVYDGFTISVKGAEAKRIVEAVSAARKESNPGLSTCRELRIEFFQDTNFLGTVEACRAIVGIDRVPYIDKTGVLEALADKVRQEHLKSMPHDR